MEKTPINSNKGIKAINSNIKEGHKKSMSNPNVNDLIVKQENKNISILTKNNHAVITGKKTEFPKKTFNQNIKPTNLKPEKENTNKKDLISLTPKPNKILASNNSNNNQKNAVAEKQLNNKIGTPIKNLAKVENLIKGKKNTNKSTSNQMAEIKPNIAKKKGIDNPIDFESLIEKNNNDVKIPQEKKNNNIPKDPKKRVSWVLCLFDTKKDLVNYVKGAPCRETTKLEDLMIYLNSYSEDIIEKFMIIYVWICHNIKYDTESFFGGNIKHEDCTAEEVFRRGCGVCSGFSTIFEKICKGMNLNCISITGYSKAFGYKKGMIFTKTDHAWNAVEYDGCWYLIESTWGSGNLDSNNIFQFQFNPFYFFCPPQFFIDEHLPQNSNYQYLSNPISKQEFEANFHYNIGSNYQKLYNKKEFSLISPNFTIINLDYLKENKEFFSLKIQCESNKKIMANLFKVQEKNGEDIKILNRTFLKDLDDKKEILYSIPEDGNYKIWIYEYDNDSKNFVSCFHYYLHCKNFPKKNLEFPIVFQNDFKHELIEPILLKLKIGSKVMFRLKAENCNAVAVVQNHEFSNLNLNSNGVWEREVEIRVPELGLFTGLENGSYLKLYGYEGIGSIKK